MTSTASGPADALARALADNGIVDPLPSEQYELVEVLPILAALASRGYEVRARHDAMAHRDDIQCGQCGDWLGLGDLEGHLNAEGRTLALPSNIRAAQEAPAPEGPLDLEVPTHGHTIAHSHGQQRHVHTIDAPPTPAEPRYCSDCGEEYHGTACGYRAEARPPEGLDVDRLAWLLLAAENEVYGLTFAEPSRSQRRLAAALAARLSAGGATKP
jgi:hypothetical protein